MGCRRKGGGGAIGELRLGSLADFVRLCLIGYYVREQHNQIANHRSFLFVAYRFEQIRSPCSFADRTVQLTPCLASHRLRLPRPDDQTVQMIKTRCYLE